MAAAYAALVSAMNIINNLHHHPRPPVSLPIKQVEYLTQKISFLLEFLEGYNPHRGYSKEADPLESRIADAAYAAEYAIESHILNNGENMSYLSIRKIKKKLKKIVYGGLYEALEKVIEDMASIEEEAKQIQERVGVQHQLHTKSTPSDSSRSSIPQQSIMVGAEDVKLQMMDKLTSDLLHLQIIPVVGMGGSGKTTLARTVYEERLIKEHFDICAWATISQEYAIREIFAAVLRQINIALDDDLNDDELGEMLYKHLYGRRYLIIMDDMWSIDAWDRVRNYFPNNENGSRIVVTTRLSDLASTLPNSDSLGMKLLDDDESWQLLSKTVFGEEGCPLELEEIGKKIGKTCKGLPLSIVVVGGLLAKSKHEKEFWKYIGENFNDASVNLEDDERCLKILYMSYKHLPIHLKPCFLYMGVFPEDKKIFISELIKYWVVEGFVKAVSGKSLEEIAKEYLKDLISRNLVLSHELDNIGNIKKCKIHDLLRDLCLREAQKERFYYTALDNVAIRVLPPMSQARSLTWNVQKIQSPLNASLLRIVKTTGVEWLKNDLFGHTNQFVNSRFVQISSYGKRLRNYPCSIWRFWNLQTLIVDTSDEVTAPTDFWYMPHIRHVEFDNGLRLPDPPNDRDDIVLGNLQSLGKGLDFKCSKQVVKKIPNIKKLVFSNWGELDDEMYCLSNLDCLTKLESLHCEISGKYVINFPHSLKSLVLRNNILSSWQDILDKVGVLPHLQKLTLWLGSFNEGKWETSEGQFRSLKFLTLEYSNLEIWEIESSHFPCLECLHLDGLNELREIPLDFAEIATLREIVVEGCSDSAVVSAKRISEEHEDYYGEGALQVRVVLWSNNEAGLESLDGPNFCVER
ncbi:putative late blight resistance protein homolog R1B-16 [Salvia miltiorrhiza]|uniref:putative late blight resistance protein homolog R1B-16 n=1 Tax=Salvia miltiorrhiza TaxID=226208 RepID=UPI0025ACF8DA|nr:putative late blight resistance protein homolog R1B-16 [Salvia miltiorrhiza]XP_057763715.1 putative late blight resistance protein homolog R1B-16 [Salvia miltiorrhiza]XP_057763716.1 putative late blight resistance protein homolog R1B-16 [Salvia miltiorrhiza]XP_057763717.1 putative late blight resistance protein homolog R1B-16 [Salvia miltiorrhiza]XP_057763719.1 putative late blight resistance protein homolog R1B-16 [Salvia miltiorrhiza]XP_057763720.1 putative late blight resistance protein 